MSSRLASALALVLLAVSCTGREDPSPSSARPSSSSSSSSPSSSSSSSPSSSPSSPSPSPSPSPSSPSPPSSPPSASPTPPYDLAADLSARLELARAHLGPDAPTAIVADVFAFVGAPGTPACSAFPAATRHATDVTAALLHGRFDARPRAVTVYVFCEPLSYDRYCRTRLARACPSTLGFYEKTTREAFVQIGPGLGTLTHELVHAFVEADFPGAPDWLNEGIASLFEAPVLPAPGEIRGADNWRLPRLVAALHRPARPAESGRPHLASLFTSTDAAFREGDVDLHYAVARYVCAWLDARGWLWPFYRAWRDGAAGNATGESTFHEVTGMTPAEAQRAWEAWVLGARG